MTDAAVVPDAKPLSQIERIIDTFVAPSRTFTDILRSTSWWLPFLLAVVVTLFSTVAMDKKIGFDNIAAQSIEQNTKAQEQMAELSPQERAGRMRMITASMKYSMYGSFLIILIFTAILSLLNWASLNFGLGASTTYGQNFAVCLYASLPRVFLGILNIIFIYAGVNTDNFNLNNPVGSNIGYYLSSSPMWLRSALSFIDIFGLWSLALMIIGTSIIARKTKAQTAIVVVGWWLVGLILSTAMAALRG
jgi:hypothetical protein